LNAILEKASGQVEVLLAISDSEPPLASGALLSVTVPIASERNVVSVPRTALFRTTEGDFVYTVSGEHFVRTAVRLGSVNPEFAEVTDGLYAGDQFVIKPVMALWMAELQSLRGGKACADGH
jgi:multidrug efflux pump subunit AcrA (membrane-fusion protein)